MDKEKLLFDIIKTKLMMFIAIAGGVWIYGIKNELFIVEIVSYVIFTLSCYGIWNNLIKLGKLEKEIEDE
jgi:hypothetical protein